MNVHSDAFAVIWSIERGDYMQNGPKIREQRARLNGDI
jgi:hypothetical protein